MDSTFVPSSDDVSLSDFETDCLNFRLSSRHALYRGKQSTYMAILVDPERILTRWVWTGLKLRRLEVLCH